MDAWLIVIFAICVAGILAFVVQRVVRAHQQQVSAGREELVGMTAEVETDLNPKGIVLIEAERWSGFLLVNGKVNRGEEVVVSKVDGLKLLVVKNE